MGQKHYTEEFKTIAVNMVLKDGLTRTEVARRLEISSKNVSRWVKEYQENQADETGGSKTLLKQKILELEKENRRLRMEQEILKKAAAFFAKEVL